MCFRSMLDLEVLPKNLYRLQLRRKMFRKKTQVKRLSQTLNHNHLEFQGGIGLA